MISTLEDIITAFKNNTLAEHRHTNLELKESWSLDHGKKLSALANKQGTPKAWLVVGVTDAGLGTNRPEKWARSTEEAISQHLNQNLDPVQACNGIHCIETQGHWLIVIELHQPGVVVKWAHEAYKASGTTIAPMHPEEVMALTVRLPGVVDYSKQPWLGQCNDTLVKKFATQLSRHRSHDPSLANLEQLPTNEILQRVGIQAHNAAKILFGNCKFRLTVFNHADAVILNETRTGLFSTSTTDFHQEIQGITKQLLGTSEPPYSELALKEALANMVAHAAYFESDGEIIVEAHPDKLVLSNLCLPESGYFANKWFSRSHKSTNALLMETLRLCGVVDELGRGKNLIFRESIYAGRKPPQVFVESAGRYNRWKLVLPGGTRDEISLRLLKRLREIFQDEQKALIAQALVAWRNQPVSEIKKYIDEESLPKFLDVLDEFSGPVFYFKDEDRVILNRWAEVLLGEGKDSKKLSSKEEDRIFWTAYRIQTRYHNGVITNQEFRSLASMGNTRSEQALASSTLTDWSKKQWIDRIGKGKYKFRPQPQYDAQEAAKEQMQQLMKAFTSWTVEYQKKKTT